MPYLNLEAWRVELTNDPDSTFLLQGLTKGFDLVNNDAILEPVEVGNHPSASPGSKDYELVKQHILSEISGNYLICDNKPDLVSPLRAAPKPAGVYG